MISLCIFQLNEQLSAFENSLERICSRCKLLGPRHPSSAYQHFTVFRISNTTSFIQISSLLLVPMKTILKSRRSLLKNCGSLISFWSRGYVKRMCLNSLQLVVQPDWCSTMYKRIYRSLNSHIFGKVHLLNQN